MSLRPASNPASHGAPRPGRLRPRARIELGDYPVDAAWSGDGRTLAVAGGEGGVLLLGADSCQPQVIGRHQGGVLAVAWQAAGRLFASSGQDGIVRLWDARSLESSAIHTGSEWSERLAFADNGRLLAVASGRTLQLFDPKGQPAHCFPDHAGAIVALAWRPKSSEIAAAGNGGVRIHRLQPQTGSRNYPWPRCLPVGQLECRRPPACGGHAGRQRASVEHRQRR